MARSHGLRLIRLTIAALGALVVVACGDVIVRPNTPEPPPEVDSGPWLSISAGGSHTCGLIQDGRAFCWGSNASGQLGDGTLIDSPERVATAGGLTFALISTGGEHTCGVATDGNTYCWGENGDGQLGNNTNTGSKTPDLVAGDLFLASVHAGIGSHTCGIDTGGKGYCWGSNSHGQLGTADSASRNVPEPVARSLLLISIGAGNTHSCAIAISTDAFCWGSGALGAGTRPGDTSAPVLVLGDLAFISVTTGRFHTCGLTAGKTYCWGDNNSGQLGNGVGSARFTPQIAVSGLNFDTISAGDTHSCGITGATGTEGVMFCWGNGSDGQLGNGIGTIEGHGTLVDGGLNFLTVSAGGAHTCGVTLEGVGYCWGNNENGQLGDGTDVTAGAPVRVVEP